MCVQVTGANSNTGTTAISRKDTAAPQELQYLMMAEMETPIVLGPLERANISDFLVIEVSSL